MTRFFRMMALSSVLLLGACTGNVDLLNGISENEGNAALAALLDAGLDAHKQVTKDGVNIRVDSNEVAQALDTLKALGLPRERFDGMGQIFRKEGLVSSPLEERARYLYALSQELGSTLSQIDGVLVARVHVVLPERGVVGENATPSTAAVFIKHRSDYTLDALQPQIRQLVTHSIPDLDEDQVTVVLIPAHPVAQNSAAAATDASSPSVMSPVTLLHAASPAAKVLLIALILLAAAGVALAVWLLGRRLRQRLLQRDKAAPAGDHA